METFTFSEPDMFIVFILSLLLALPPLTITVYLWTSVARFYEEIKNYEENDEHLLRKHTTMRIIGNLILNQPPQTVSVPQRTSNLNNQVLNGAMASATKRDGISNTIMMKNLNHLKETNGTLDHKNDL